MECFSANELTIFYLWISNNWRRIAMPLLKVSFLKKRDSIMCSLSSSFLDPLSIMRVFNLGSHIARTWVNINTKPTIIALPLPLHCIVCPELSCQDITFLPDRGEQIETDCHFYSLTWEKIFKRWKTKNRLDPLLLPWFWSIGIFWTDSANQDLESQMLV